MWIVAAISGVSVVLAVLGVYPASNVVLVFSGYSGAQYAESTRNIRDIGGKRPWLLQVVFLKPSPR